MIVLPPTQSLYGRPQVPVAEAQPRQNQATPKDNNASTIAGARDSTLEEAHQKISKMKTQVS